MIRLDASRDTLDAFETQIFDFLRENGFQPTANGLERPYVIFDRTNYNTKEDARTTSQLKRLLSAGSRDAQALGIKPETLKRKFGGVSLAANTDPLSPIRLSNQDIERPHDQ